MYNKLLTFIITSQTNNLGMRIGLSVSFLISVLVYSQDLVVEAQDSLPAATSLGTTVKDSLFTSPLLKKKSILLYSQISKNKRKNSILKSLKRNVIPLHQVYGRGYSIGL